MDKLGTSILSIVQRLSFFRGGNVWSIYRQGVNSLSIVGRLSTLQSVHYRRFHCMYIRVCGSQYLKRCYIRTFLGNNSIEGWHTEYCAYCSSAHVSIHLRIQHLLAGSFKERLVCIYKLYIPPTAVGFGKLYCTLCLFLTLFWLFHPYFWLCLG